MDWGEDAFFALDPFYSPATQPLEVTDDEMIETTTGPALVVRR